MAKVIEAIDGRQSAACVASIGVTAAKSLIGRTLGRLLAPPAAHHRIRRGIHRVRVPMRDGVELLADHYRPLTTNPAGTLLVRAPYGRGYPVSVLFGSRLRDTWLPRHRAERARHLRLRRRLRPLHARGRRRRRHRRLAPRPALVHRFVRHHRVSYLGFTQWALLTDPPPEMAAAIITVGPHDISGPRWGTGSFASQRLRRLERHRLPPGGPRPDPHHRAAAARPAMVAHATAGLPVGDAGRTLLGEGAPWFESWLDHPEHDDPFWAPTQPHTALERTEIPVLLLTGWQDVFIEQTLEQYPRLRSVGSPLR